VNRLLWLALALAACKSSKDDLPIGIGGGGTGGGGGGIDASVDTSTIDGGPVAGRVCLLTDPRDLVACAGAGAGGLSVTLGTLGATTADDGTFTIVPDGSGLVWHVTGSSIVTSVMPYTAGSAQVPAMTQTMYVSVQGDTGAAIQLTEGSVFARVTSSGVALAGAAASSNPQAMYNTYYDGTTVSAWKTTSTGALGTAFIPGIGVGTASIAVVPSGGATKTIPGVPIEDGALTFLAVSIP
jgi:hypothetical protein